MKGFEIKWNPKNKVKIPNPFLEAYDAEVVIINKDSFREFLK